ncbi:MAG: hypothetical protein NE327_06705 [Lentisphaeraceae bacterium]|nr:hypothetical protein [Lentisphaeraceae bacterium]
MAKAPSCIKCVHYYVTYDTAYPRGCKLFEVKSRMMPTYAFLKSTGQHCPAFQLRPSKKPSE